MCLKHADEHDEGEVDDEVDGTGQSENLENRECLAHQALCISRDLENRDCRGKARTLDDEDQLIAVFTEPGEWRAGIRSGGNA